MRPVKESGTTLASARGVMVPSKDLSPADASILALIAENPDLRHDEFEQLVEELSAQEVAEIARAIIDEDIVVSAAARETARSIREWAESNRRATAAGRQRAVVG